MISQEVSAISLLAIQDMRFVTASCFVDNFVNRSEGLYDTSDVLA